MFGADAAESYPFAAGVLFAADAGDGPAGSAPEAYNEVL
jgi:hypothetical protein